MSLIINPYRFAGGAPPPTNALLFDPSRKSAEVTLSGGNTIASTETGAGHFTAKTAARQHAGQWIFEMQVVAVPASGNIGIGIMDQAETINTTSPGTTRGGNYWGTSAQCRHYDSTSYDGVSVAYTPGVGDRITVTFDFTTKEMTVYNNGTLAHAKTITTITLPDHLYVPFVDLWGAAGDPATVEIPATILYPQSGFATWVDFAAGSVEFTGITWSQSSVYAGLAVTDTNMRDGNYTTGGATTSGAQWIQADLGSAKEVLEIIVAGGNISGWGNVAAYVNGRSVEYSNDASSWTSLGTIAGATNVAPFEVSYPVPAVTARYWRLYIASGSVATTEFRIYGTP